MDIISLVGFVMCWGFFVLALGIAANWNFVAMGMFIDGASIMIVFGMTIMAVLCAAPLKVFLSAMKAQKIIFMPPSLDPAAGINKIVELANIARKEGVLALEDSASNMDDEFLKKGVMLIVDGTAPELVKNIMETEMAYIEERHSNTASVFDSIAAYAPAFGMCGTLIGLILMLADMDPETLGQQMAVAFITTLYGALMANAYANPFGTKLKKISQEEILLKTVMVEGMLSIQAGENPRIIEEKLKSFLSPVVRSAVGESAGGGGGAE